jgi:hypothetical protein
MRPHALVTLVLVLIVLAGGVFLLVKKSPKPIVTPEPVPTNNNSGRVETSMIRVDEPLMNASIKSPVRVRGEARGNWYFEASFPAEILDANGKQLAIVPIQAIGEWMTTEFVPFDTSISFPTPTTNTGTIVLHKDNPSGLPEYDDEVRIPVVFSEAVVKTRDVKLYYYDASKDKDASGNIMCSSKGLVPVDRAIPVSLTPIQDTIKLLIKGELSSSERAAGISTDYPLSGFELKSASLTGGILTLTFDDPEFKTSGGACKATVLRSQIEATAKAFTEVKSVRILPATLFQP